MRKQKIYLDTSVISHLEAWDTPEKMLDTLLIDFGFLKEKSINDCRHIVLLCWLAAYYRFLEL